MEPRKAPQERTQGTEKFLEEVKTPRLASKRELVLLCQFLNYRYRISGAVTKALANYSKEQLKRSLR